MIINALAFSRELAILNWFYLTSCKDCMSLKKDLSHWISYYVDPRFLVLIFFGHVLLYNYLSGRSALNFMAFGLTIDSVMMINVKRCVRVFITTPPSGHGLQILGL